MKDSEEQYCGFKTRDENGKKFTIKKILDSYGTTHVLTEQLGEVGGQGIVFKTVNPRIAIKFFLGKHNKNDDLPFVYSKEISKKMFRTNALKIQKIIEKPFPKNSHISYPMARLEDYSGYVMLLMDDMCNFSNLIDCNKTIEVGGLRRKYDLLAKLSIILSRIHSLGMVYCDISSNNIFITKDPNYKNQNVWLIDSDNIYIPSFDEYGGQAYTEKYAAPEIVNAKSLCSTNSDVYAFASLAFETIFNRLPFAGKKATNWYENDTSSSNDWDAEDSSSNMSVDPRYSGKYAWILDANDDSNRVDGLTLENSKLYLTDSIYKLFSLIFTDGKLNPNLRAPIFVWPQYLFEAKDLVINCKNPGCKASFIFNTGLTRCPYCNEKLPNMIQIFNKDKLIFVHELDFNSSEQFNLPERLFLPFNIETGNNSYFKIKNISGKAIEFQLTREHINIKDRFYILNKNLNNIEKLIISKIKMELEENNYWVLSNKSQIKNRQRELNIIIK